MALAFALIGRADNPRAQVNSNAPEVENLSEAKRDKILPDLGENSPEICILRIDPKTHATSLLIRTPKTIHVCKHWHTANETHTIIKGTATFAYDAKKFELGEGGFNFMPAKMVHEAWLPENSLMFHHRRWRIGRQLGRMTTDCGRSYQVIAPLNPRHSGAWRSPNCTSTTRKISTNIQRSNKRQS